MNNFTIACFRLGSLAQQCWHLWIFLFNSAGTPSSALENARSAQVHSFKSSFNISVPKNSQTTKGSWAWTETSNQGERNDVLGGLQQSLWLRESVLFSFLGTSERQLGTELIVRTQEINCPDVSHIHAYYETCDLGHSVLFLSTSVFSFIKWE